MGGADLINLSDSLYMVNDFREMAPCFQEAGFSNDAPVVGEFVPVYPRSECRIISLYLGDGEVNPPLLMSVTNCAAEARSFRRVLSSSCGLE